MSLVHLANALSHLQNATRARLGSTSLPQTNQLLNLSLGLLEAGFISSVTRGSKSGPDAKPTPTTPENVASRRLWLELKYYDNKPVLNKASMVSRPRQRIHVGTEGLRELCEGRDFAYVKALQPGECLFVSTDRGIMEAREAVKRKIGGMVMCRVK